MKEFWNTYGVKIKHETNSKHPTSLILNISWYFFTGHAIKANNAHCVFAPNVQQLNIDSNENGNVECAAKIFNIGIVTIFWV